MHEAGARVEAEALEPDRPRRRLEGLGIVVRHGDVEGDALHVLRRLRAADGAVVLGAAVGRADDQRLAETRAQRLQRVERRLVDEQLAGAAAGDLGGREVRPAPGGRRARRASGRRRSWGSSETKEARRAGGLGVGWAESVRARNEPPRLGGLAEQRRSRRLRPAPGLDSPTAASSCVRSATGPTSADGLAVPAAQATLSAFESPRIARHGTADVIRNRQGGDEPVESDRDQARYAEIETAMSATTPLASARWT